MKVLFSFFTALLLLVIYCSPKQVRSQDSHEYFEQGETSEEIMQREQYIYERRAGGPGKVVSPDAYQNALQQMLSMPIDKNSHSITATGTWITANPTGMFYSVTGANYISGRTNSVAVHPTNPQIIYIGAAQGGVWKTTDGGVNWFPLTDGLPNHACGDICIDPANPNVLYLGTGELNYSLDSFYGNGIYKSTDAGATWVQVATTTVGSRFSQMVVDPTNSNIVYAAGSNGVYKSTNAGANWTTTASGSNANCLFINPLNHLSLLESVGGNTAGSIRKSFDGGATWIIMNTGLPTTKGRIQLAMAPTDTAIIYASIAQPAGALLGLYKTTDGANNWTLQANSPNYMSGQGWYDNAVVVNPSNPNAVVVAGLDVYSSVNSGVTLTQRSQWATGNTNAFSHADVHTLRYYGSILYCGSDGGIYKSTNDGVTWTDLNATISTLQFQSADIDATNLLKLYGGCQDNNKQTTTNGGTNWIQRTTGDGGYTVVDPVTPLFIYGQYVNGSFQRSANGGLGFVEVKPTGSTGGLFYNPYEMAPGDHNTVVYGQTDLWKTTNAQTCTGTSGWTQIATTADVNGSVSAIGISAQSTDVIYAGTSSGRMIVTTNNGANWTNPVNGAYITDIAVDITNDNIAYATYGGSGSVHLIKTTDRGVTWTNITGLPSIAANSVCVRTTAPRMIFVGTDMGVYKTDDEGATWTLFSTGMPTMQIYDMKYKESVGILLAVTHGRGCWTFDINSIIGIQSETGPAKEFKLSQNYPNPFNPSTLISFDLPKEAKVKLTVFDMTGREVAVLSNSNRNPGHHAVNWDASKYSSGVYFYKIVAEETSGKMNIETRKMVLVK